MRTTSAGRSAKRTSGPNTRVFIKAETIRGALARVNRSTCLSHFVGSCKAPVGRLTSSIKTDEKRWTVSSAAAGRRNVLLRGLPRVAPHAAGDCGFPSGHRPGGCGRGLRAPRPAAAQAPQPLCGLQAATVLYRHRDTRTVRLLRNGHSHLAQRASPLLAGENSPGAIRVPSGVSSAGWAEPRAKRQSNAMPSAGVAVLSLPAADSLEARDQLTVEDGHLAVEHQGRHLEREHAGHQLGEASL